MIPYCLYLSGTLFCMCDAERLTLLQGCNPLVQDRTSGTPAYWSLAPANYRALTDACDNDSTGCGPRNHDETEDTFYSSWSCKRETRLLG